MIAHAAKGMNPVPKPFHAFLHQQIKVMRICIRKENTLRYVAMQHHMIESTEDLNHFGVIFPAACGVSYIDERMHTQEP